MLEIDYTLFFQIVNFLLLLFLLNLIIYRPVRQIMNKRKEEISSTVDMTQDWTQKAEKYAEELEENIIGARKEGLKNREDLKYEGLEREKMILKEAFSSTEGNLARLRGEINDKIAQVSKSLQNEVEGFSHELAEKILGRGL